MEVMDLPKVNGEWWMLQVLPSYLPQSYDHETKLKGIGTTFIGSNNSSCRLSYVEYHSISSALPLMNHI